MNRMTMAGSPSSVLLNRIAQGYMDWRSSLGAEMVTNGAFTGAATGWTLGSGWTYGTNAVDRDGGGTATMTQATCIPVAGGIYKVTYTISAYTDGNVTVSIGGTSGTARSSAATFTEYIKAGAATVLTFTPAADSTFTIDDVSVKKVGVLTADGVAMWVDDRGATAGKGAMHMWTEDGTAHVFGDRVGIGTLYPAVFCEINGVTQINDNIQFGATGKGIAAASADAATVLFIARNAAAQTQTVAQITGNATVANSTFDITKGRLTGNLQLGAYYLSGDGGDEGITIAATGAVTCSVVASQNAPHVIQVSNNGHTAGGLKVNNAGGIWSATNAAIWLIDTTATRWQVLGDGSNLIGSNTDLASAADLVKIGGYDLSPGNRTLCLAVETAVAADVGLASTHSLSVRINGVSYKIHLTAV